MKCGKCGAEIPESSNYCNNCGTPLKTEEPIHGNPLSEDYLKLRKYLITHKEWLLGYAVWFVINFFLLLFGGEKYRDKVYVYAPELVFFPFKGKAENYDITEFFVYIVALPVIAYAVYFFYKKYESFFKKVIKSIRTAIFG